MLRSIGAKIVLAMVAASLIGGATALNSNMSLGRMDRVYSNLLSEQVAGALVAADLAAQSQLLTGLTYRLVTEFKADELNTTRSEIAVASTQIVGEMDTIRRQLPGSGPEVDAIQEDFKSMSSSIELAVVAALAGDPDKTATITQEAVVPRTKNFNLKVAALASESQKALEARRAETGQDTARTVRIGYFTTAIAIVLSTIAGLVFARGSISTPVRRLTTVMGAIAAGNTEVTIPGLDRSDELGAMALAVEVFRENAEKVSRQDKEQERAARDALQAEDRRHVMNELASTFERSVGSVIEKVSRAAKDIERNTAELAKAALDASSRAESVAAESIGMAENVESAAVATDEMGKTIEEISVNVDHSQRIAVAASEQTTKTVEIVSQLTSATQRIGQIVDLINGIARQTELLALNATIEAARAGEAGAGFSVVASEVKSLANATSKATGEISAQISAVQQATGAVVTAMGSIDTIIGQVREITTGIAASVQEQNASMRGISDNVDHAAKRTSSLSDSAGDVSRAASATGRSADNMKAHAAELALSASTLTSEVDVFLRGIRHA